MKRDPVSFEVPHIEGLSHRRKFKGILTAQQIAALRESLQGRLLSLCFGAGVDSTAMIVALWLAGIVPDVITFADTGGEKPATLTHIAAMNRVLTVVTCI